MISVKDIAVFDSYLKNELTSDEKKDFEEKLAASKSYLAEFENYKQDCELIQEAFEYDAIKDDLKATHRSLFAKKSTPLFTRPAFLYTIGIAASIALLFTITTLNGTVTDKNSGSGYQELANTTEETTIDYTTTEDSDGTTNNTNLQSDTTPLLTNINPIHKIPRGTSFIISDNGYFLTAKHLVKNRQKVVLQQKETEMTFETWVVYEDSLSDFALLKCDDSIANLFNKIPFAFLNSPAELGDEVFTLGYPKKNIVYTNGVVSSETGFKSDSLYLEISLPSNSGNSGAPLFSTNGKLVGLITANHANKQAVTYALKHEHISTILDSLTTTYSFNLIQNKTPRLKKRNSLIKSYRNYIFEVH